MDLYDRVSKPILTRREEQILKLMAEGKAYKTIAADLGIKLMTVKNHACSIYTKLGAVSQANAVYKYFIEKPRALEATLRELIEAINRLLDTGANAG